VVVQKRSSLLVGRYDVLFSSEANFLAKDTWNSDDKGGNEEYAHDDKSKDPLECNGSGEELTDPESSCQDAKCEAYGVILEDNEEEEAIDQDAPDCDIGKDTCCQGVRIDCNGTVPVQSNKCPCQWSRDNRNVDEPRVCVVAEV